MQNPGLYRSQPVTCKLLQQTVKGGLDENGQSTNTCYESDTREVMKSHLLAGAILFQQGRGDFDVTRYVELCVDAER
jgi:hypothetical protein